jgi:hypothetical protein
VGITFSNIVVLSMLMRLSIIELRDCFWLLDSRDGEILEDESQSEKGSHLIYKES